MSVESTEVFPKKSYNFCFTWIIDDFSERLKLLLLENLQFSSPLFFSDLNRNYLWNLECCAELHMPPTVQLYLDSDFPENVYGTCKFVITGHDEEFINQVSVLSKERDFLAYALLNSANLAVSSQVKVYVEIKFYQHTNYFCAPTYSPENHNAMLKYFSSLFNEHKLSDVTIKVKEKSFFAHKLVLAAHSSVFETMFGSNWKNDDTDIVTLTDFDPNTIEEFLRFMYKGRISEALSFNLLCELYQLSDMYAVNFLKNICGTCLYRNLNDSNALDLLWLVDSCSDNELKKKVIQHIRHNPNSLSNVSKCKSISFKALSLLGDREEVLLLKNDSTV